MEGGQRTGGKRTEEEEDGEVIRAALVAIRSPVVRTKEDICGTEYKTVLRTAYRTNAKTFNAFLV